jgi:hypothetical protein
MAMRAAAKTRRLRAIATLRACTTAGMTHFRVLILFKMSAFYASYEKILSEAPTEVSIAIRWSMACLVQGQGRAYAGSGVAAAETAVEVAARAGDSTAK